MSELSFNVDRKIKNAEDILKMLMDAIKRHQSEYAEYTVKMDGTIYTVRLTKREEYPAPEPLRGGGE